MILERRIQKLKPGLSDDAYRNWENSWAAIEARMGGFPAKRHCYLLSGQMESGTVVWERGWESFAAMEAAYMKMMLPDPEVTRLNESSVIVSEHWEYYWVDPEFP